MESNVTCWRTIADQMNFTRAKLMLPVIGMMTMFMLVGAFGNALVLFVYRRRTRKTTSTFIMILAATDLFASVFIHPYIIYKLFNNYDQTWVGLCKIFEFFVHLNLGTSALVLLLIAVDRFFAICRPMKFLLVDKNMYKGMIAICALSVVISTPLFEFYGAAPYEIDLGNVIFVEYKCHYQVKYQNSPALLVFSCFIMTGFLIETIAMTCLYRSVAVTAYRSIRAIRPLSNAHILAGFTPRNARNTPNPGRTTVISRTPSPVQTTSRDFTTTENLESRRNTLLFARTFSIHASKEMKDLSIPQRTNNTVEPKSYKNGADTRNLVSRLKAAKMLFLVTAVFFLSWLPFFVMRICYILNPNYLGIISDWKLVLESLLNHFIYLSNAANPLIYTFINKEFRKECLRLFHKCFKGR